MACNSRQRERYPDWPALSSPASRQTWTEAVPHIIRRPHGPSRSKNFSIATYRGRLSSTPGRA